MTRSVPDVWLASQTVTPGLRSRLRRGLDRHLSARARLPDQLLARSQTVEVRREGTQLRRDLDRLLAEGQRVLGAVAGTQLHPDRDERRHADHARCDLPVLAGEQRERLGGLLVARSAGSALPRARARP